MGGRNCRDCNAIKPLFVSPEPSSLEIPCLGTVPFDPELERHCDTGHPLTEVPDTPVVRPLVLVTRHLLDCLQPHPPSSTHDYSALPLFTSSTAHDLPV